MAIHAVDCMEAGGCKWAEGEAGVKAAYIDMHFDNSKGSTCEHCLQHMGSLASQESCRQNTAHHSHAAAEVYDTTDKSIMSRTYNMQNVI